MADWDDVRRVALALPGSVERTGATLSWAVNDKAFLWERPLRRGDLEALGLVAQDGPVLAARVADVAAKEELVAAAPRIYFTTPHFHGYPAVLVRLDVIDGAELAELAVDAWLCRAPKRMAREFLSGSGTAGGGAP